MLSRLGSDKSQSVAIAPFLSNVRAAIADEMREEYPAGLLGE